MCLNIRELLKKGVPPERYYPGSIEATAIMQFLSPEMDPTKEEAWTRACDEYEKNYTQQERDLLGAVSSIWLGHMDRQYSMLLLALIEPDKGNEWIRQWSEVREKSRSYDDLGPEDEMESFNILEDRGQ